MSKAERNENAKQFILEKINKSESKEIDDYRHLNDFENLESCLNDLIHVNPKGFRGVVATAITGMHINPEFNPLTNFYSCNPRSIFEQGIFYAYQEKNIPAGSQIL